MLLLSDIPTGEHSLKNNSNSSIITVYTLYVLIVYTHTYSISATIVKT